MANFFPKDDGNYNERVLVCGGIENDAETCTLVDFETETLKGEIMEADFGLSFISYLFQTRAFPSQAEMAMRTAWSWKIGLG